MSETVDLDAAQALADAASPGPWLACRSSIEGILHVSIPDAMNPTAWPADAEFIAQSRSLVPELIDLIARLKGERGTALQTAACYRAQRDLAWAEIDRLKEQLNG